MRKILVVIGLVLLLGACSDTEQVAKGSTEQADKEKDNELIVEINGKKEVIAAEIVEMGSTNTTTFPTFVKEIKVPAGADVSVSKETGGVVVVLGGESSLYIKKANNDYSTEILIHKFTMGMELTEKDRKVPVIEMNLSDYPELAKYEAMYLADGNIKKTYYLVEDNEGEKYETIIQIPATEKNIGKRLNTLLKVATTIK